MPLGFRIVLAPFVLLFVATASGAEIKVMLSRAFTPVYRETAPQFERATRNTLATSYASSMGTAPDSIWGRLQRGELVDVVIVGGDVLDELIKQGKVVPGSKVDLVRSGIGMVVRSGAPKPDISSLDALKSTLLRAKSIALSEFYSGVYLSTELFPRLGLGTALTARIKRVPAEPVAAVVARGEAEIGFQQISELVPVPGIEYVGALPPEAQKFTVFSAGLAVGAQEPDAAKALIKFLTSEATASAIVKSGLERVPPRSP